MKAFSMTFSINTDLALASKSRLKQFFETLENVSYHDEKARMLQKDLLNVLDDVFALENNEFYFLLDSKYMALNGINFNANYRQGHYQYLTLPNYPHISGWQNYQDLEYLQLCIAEVVNSPHFYGGKSLTNYQKKYSEIQKLKTELETIKEKVLPEVRDAQAEIVALSNTEQDGQKLSQLIDFIMENYNNTNSKFK
jgi:hypothetical protein